MPAATETVTFWSAYPALATLSEPEAGETVMPAGGFAAHVTAPPEPTAFTRSVASTEPPGSTDAIPGEIADRNGFAPVPNDGGASSGSPPNAVFGWAPRA